MLGLCCANEVTENNKNNINSRMVKCMMDKVQNITPDFRRFNKIK